MVDIVNAQLKGQFECLSKLSNFLQPKNVIDTDEKNLLAAEILQMQYCDDLSINFPIKLLNVAFVKTEITDKGPCEHDVIEIFIFGK